MFRQARIKLTTQYLAIIMLISFFFSLVIYFGINRELRRIEHTQDLRQQKTENFLPVFEEFRRNRERSGLPVPTFEISAEELISIPETRIRILSILGLINLTILGISGLAGYYLAGETLAPIAKMMEDQKEFVANASHELRTPLTSLKSEIEVALRDKKMSIKQARVLLKSNLEEVDKMQALSNYLLRLNKYQSMNASPPFTQVNLKSTVEEAVKKVQPQARVKHIRIVKRLEKVKVGGNEESLVELATILLDNAIKYSDSGKEVIIVTQRTSRGVNLKVQDFGLGIDKDELPHIFDRFYRADSSRAKGKVDGFGLGLSIAKSITDANKAKISVESTPGKGSTFTVRFS